MNFHVLAICRASLPLRGIYSLERTNSLGVNVALDKCMVSVNIFLFSIKGAIIQGPF